MGNRQIKVKEAPGEWFVSTTPYPSGNKEFIKDEFYEPWSGLCLPCKLRTKAGIENNYENGKQFHKNCGVIGCQCSFHTKEKFGTKHIQLFGANMEIERRKYENNRCVIVKYEDEFDESITISEHNYQKAMTAQQQGKDYFIYKVSEVK